MRFVHFSTVTLLSIFFLCSIGNIGSAAGADRHEPKSIQTTNSLIVRDQWGYQTVNGFIDQPVLVIEPHGAYAEQSLYIKYSDRGTHPYRWSNLEVVHKFELPKGATVNDLWLWIGDSVMQAIVIDTWKGRHIYDSILAIRRDPAFLAKTGDQYELHVYPMLSGTFRKIKLTFITPITWTGTRGNITLPMAYLNASAATTRPLTVLFRERSSAAWSDRQIAELPHQEFTTLPDTNGYHFVQASIGDVSTLAAMHFSFTGDFTDNLFFSGNERPGSPTYFQIGMIPDHLFTNTADSAARNVVVGLDFSGRQSGPLPDVLSKIGAALKSALRPIDTMDVLAAARNHSTRITTAPVPALPDSIDAILERLASSPLGAQIAAEGPKRLLFADANAAACWTFPGIDVFATVNTRTSLVDALDHIGSADIVAAYNYGYEDAGPSAARRTEILARLDSLLARGGTFIGFFDANRMHAGDTISTAFFPGLAAVHHSGGSINLFANRSGRIGRFFPATIPYSTFDYLSYTPDTSIRVEMADSAGRAVIISKRVGTGMAVISSLWSFQDSGSTRKGINPYLLNLAPVIEIGGRNQLEPMLATIRTMNAAHPARTALIFTNNDTVLAPVTAASRVATYLAGYTSTPPCFLSVNMIDGKFATAHYTLADGMRFFGAGYMLKLLADGTGGSEQESHDISWPGIVSALQYSTRLPISRINLNISGDGGAATALDVLPVAPISSNAAQTRFYVGSINARNTITFDLSARFVGASDSQTVRKTYLLSHDTTTKNAIIPAMLANEQISNLFLKMAQTANPDTADTVRIIDIAVRNHLLCDFTAMLALEPNSQNPFLHNPFDESGIVVAGTETDPDVADSLSIDIFPNPFNSTTTFRINVPRLSDFTLGIYNMLGQQIMEYDRASVPAGVTSLRWDGIDKQGQPVSSGIYFVRLVTRNANTGAGEMRVKKILLVK